MLFSVEISVIWLNFIAVMIRQFLFSAAVFATALPLNAQTSTLADLTQDVALMRREVGQLRLEVEQLRRENETLASRIRAAENSSVSSDAVKAQSASLQTSVDAKMAALKREIISEVKKDLDSMASQTNSAMAKLAGAVNEKPKAEPQRTFSNEYPQTGVPYVVQSGDSLSKIARKLKSKISWIQDANHISDPTSLKVGQKLFVPQE